MAAPKSLSKAEIQLLRTSWKSWESNIRENASAFFLAFFKAHVEYKNVFRIFRDMSLEEMEESPKLRAHASIIMRNLTSVLDNLDDEEVMAEVLKKIAESHFSRGVRTKHFEDLFEVFNISMKTAQGKSYDDATAKAWITLTDIIITSLDRELAIKKQIESGR